MRRHLPWIAAAAVLGAIAFLLVMALRPPVAEAPTASPSRPATSPASPSASATASPAETMTASPTARVTPPPGSATLPPDAGATPEGYRPPPDSFDPSRIRWAGDAVTGSALEKQFGLWTAAIDGGGLREVVLGAVGAGQAVPAEDGSVAFHGRSTDGVPLLVATPEGEPQTALPSVSEIVLARDAWYAAAIAQPLRDDGIWRVTSDGQAVQVAPPDPGPLCEAEVFGAGSRAGIAVSDAGVVASGVCRRDPGDTASFHLAIQLAEPGSSRLVEVDARPLGFDPTDRLVAHSDAGFVAIDVASGAASPLAGDPSGQARVTPGGRWLVTLAGGPDLVAHDLTTGSTASWAVPAGRSFDLTAFGDETHVVLESFALFPGEEMQAGWHAVIDLEEGWIGYLPPIAPFRDDPPE